MQQSQTEIVTPMFSSRDGRAHVESDQPVRGTRRDVAQPEGEDAARDSEKYAERSGSLG